MSGQHDPVLVFGYGNPGRQDDGLGPALVESIQGQLPPGVSTRINYQLTVEDAVDVAAAKVVLFVDACITGEPYRLLPVETNQIPVLGSHALSPEALMQLSRDLFASEARGYILAIRGYEFDRFEECLTPAAAGNLEQASDFVLNWLNSVTGMGRADAGAGQVPYA